MWWLRVGYLARRLGVEDRSARRGTSTSLVWFNSAAGEVVLSVALGGREGDFGTRDGVIPYRPVMQAALIPLAHTVGTDLRPAPWIDVDEVLRRETWSVLLDGRAFMGPAPAPRGDH